MPALERFPAARNGHLWVGVGLTVGAGLLSAALVSAAAAGVAPPAVRISQKHQAFRPGSVEIKRGEALAVVNDDEDLLHHAYVDSSTFKFDSGDEEPGQTVDIVFSVAGSFTVLCGIHPRMKLAVHVD